MKLMFSNTLCSAYLVEIVKSFEKNHGSSYLGRTAMQKLAYFSQATGVPIPCSFEIYNYGPYSDEVTFTVESLLADEVLCDTSGTAAYSNYRMATVKAKFPEDLEKVVAPFRQQIDRVVKTLGGFKPQQLELVATVHFIANRIKSISGKAPAKADVLERFFSVKGEKFPKEDVGRWYDSLKTAKLV
jgi:uncharacterized protein YwgA